VEVIAKHWQVLVRLFLNNPTRLIFLIGNGVEVANNIGIWWDGTWACNEWVKDKCKGDCVADIGVKPDYKYTECFEITGGLGSNRIEDTPTAKMVINKCFDEGYSGARWEKCKGDGYKIRGVCGPVIFGVAV
jgi:hypothetical protein